MQKRATQQTFACRKERGFFSTKSLSLRSFWRFPHLPTFLTFFSFLSFQFESTGKFLKLLCPPDQVLRKEKEMKKNSKIFTKCCCHSERNYAWISGIEKSWFISSLFFRQTFPGKRLSFARHSLHTHMNVFVREVAENKRDLKEASCILRGKKRVVLAHFQHLFLQKLLCTKDFFRPISARVCVCAHASVCVRLNLGA